MNRPALVEAEFSLSNTSVCQKWLVKSVNQVIPLKTLQEGNPDQNVK